MSERGVKRGFGSRSIPGATTPPLAMKSSIEMRRLAPAVPAGERVPPRRRTGRRLDLGELSLRVAVATKPLSQRWLQRVGEEEIVLAGETRQRVQNKEQDAYCVALEFITKADKEMTSARHDRTELSVTP
jgi:hypothetical protein